ALNAHRRLFRASQFRSNSQSIVAVAGKALCENHRLPLPIFIMRPSQSQFLPLRGLRYHVRSWGEEDAPRLLMLHGWMDVSASFQFLVDALSKDWYVLAPDWRGYGLTEWPQDGYWFQGYIGDLDALCKAR